MGKADKLLETTDNMVPQPSFRKYQQEGAHMEKKWTVATIVAAVIAVLLIIVFAAQPKS